MATTRDRYCVSGTVCEHTYTDWAGFRRTVRYWVREGGGYVWYVSALGLNSQPTHTDGRTWRAFDGAAIRELCKAERRRERRMMYR